MKYKISFLPLLLAGMLASCNSDEELIQTNPNYVEAGYGALTITLSNPGSGSTKAGETIDVATAEEKTISSVAFFVKTENDTNDAGELQTGKFGSYFSTEELLSANGFQEELVEVSAGEYTAKIRHKSDGWGDPKVIVIANYAENGLTETLKAIEHWEDLDKIQTAALTANPQTPLLMYATQTIEAWKRQSGGNSNGGGVAAATFELQRLVSRIDIHNNAYNSADKANGFVLTSAQLIRPKTASYLIPENTSTGGLAVAAQPFPISGTVVDDDANNIQTLDTLYTYENANDADATATAVQVNGTYRGGNISKIIPFKKADGVGTIGDPIALTRNTRYVININPAPDSTDITWNIQVKDWTEADTIKVKPVFPVPVLENIVPNLGSGMDWVETEKTIDITAATAGGTLAFETRGTTASIHKVVYGYDTKGQSIDEADAAKLVVRGEPVITYAAQVATPFTINVPTQKDDVKVPLDIYVIIQNGGNTDACDTITIKSRPAYNKTGFQPVLMKGGKYWAPINAGAKEMPTSVSASGDITKTCGNIFQWGRICGFPASPDSIPTTTTLVGDTTGFENDPTWKDLFIVTNSSSGDWLSKRDDHLWNSGSEDNPVKTSSDPCPKGWRVPTFAEFNALGFEQSNSAGKSFANGIMSIDGIDGEKLLLPAVGNRSRGNSVTTGQGLIGYYWVSWTTESGQGRRITVNNHATKPYLQSASYARSGGCSVRCIQE